MKFTGQQKIVSQSLVITLFFLCIPAIAMQFSTEVRWEMEDFVLGGILIFVLIFSLFTLKQQRITNVKKWIFGASILFVFLLIWGLLALSD